MSKLVGGEDMFPPAKISGGGIPSHKWRLCLKVPRYIYHGTLNVPRNIYHGTLKSPRYIYHSTLKVPRYIYHCTSKVPRYKCTVVKIYHGIFGAQNTVVQCTVVHFTVHCTVHFPKGILRERVNRLIACAMSYIFINSLRSSDAIYLW